MTTTLAYEVLYDAVVARFADEGTNVVNTFGWREPAKHVEGPRIVWVPGDPGGRLGSVTGARNPGRNPRPLLTTNELFTVWISSADTTDIEDERKQYKACRALYDAFLRAVYLAAHGTFYVRDERWDTKRIERQHGATVRVVIELQAPVLDEVLEVAPVDTSANITLNLQTDGDGSEVIPPGGDVDTGEGGTGGTVVKLKAGETLSALRVVRYEAGVANSVVLARPPEAESLAPLGITSQAAAQGDDVNVVVDGGRITDSSWAWTPGEPVLLAELGTLTQTPSPGLPFILVIGVAVETDTINVRIEPAIFTA
jgi:hypothetical protein